LLISNYSGQGAAQCLEDAVVISRLLGLATHREQIPDVLIIYEAVRKPRTLTLKRRSEEMRDVYCIQNGPVQEERDRQLRDLEPYPGYVIPWMDPDFQSWMYTYDANEAASEAWKIYLQGKWPGTRGYWTLS
jgi:salicylate hydroxylase